MSVRVTKDTLIPNLNEFDERAVETIRVVLQYWATQAISMMRSGARWTDRTTNARNGLMAKQFDEPADGGTLVLWHSVPYGIWLEVRWSGRYAIVGPTLNTIAPRILRMVGQGLERTSSL